MSTKDTSQKSQAISAGRADSSNMQLDTKPNATIPTPTLTDLERMQLLAESLASLELDLNDLSRAGARWQAFPYQTQTGKMGLVVAIFESSCNLGAQSMDDGKIRFTINEQAASEIATRKDEIP